MCIRDSLRASFTSVLIFIFIHRMAHPQAVKAAFSFN